MNTHDGCSDPMVQAMRQCNMVAARRTVNQVKRKWIRTVEYSGLHDSTVPWLLFRDVSSPWTHGRPRGRRVDITMAWHTEVFQSSKQHTSACHQGSHCSVIRVDNFRSNRTIPRQSPSVFSIHVNSLVFVSRRH